MRWTTWSQDDGVLRHGNSLVIDPFGEVVAECVELGDAVIVALCASEKRSVASGGRYLRARRPELYGLLTAANPTAETVQDIGPGWQRRAPSDAPYSAAAVAAAEAEAAMVAAQAEDEPVPTVEALPRAMPKPARTPRGSTERPPRRLSVDNLMAELPGAIDGESMYSQPASLYDTAANEDEEDERAEAAEMAASFGALNLGGGSSGWTADSYSVPDGFAEYAQHAQQAPTDLELPVPSVGPSLVTESIYNGISEGVPEVSADATSGSGWADDAYAVPEGYDEYVQSLTASTGTLARAQEEAGLLPTNFAPAPAPAPALASIDAVTAEESSLLPAFCLLACRTWGLSYGPVRCIHLPVAAFGYLTTAAPMLVIDCVRFFVYRFELNDAVNAIQTLRTDQLELATKMSTGFQAINERLDLLMSANSRR
eukprot:COSAG02_NODE_6764_length_3373_cov_2.226940_2_plen_427_part_00